MKERRLMKVRMSPQYLAEVLKGINRPYTSNLPKDVNVVNVQWSPQYTHDEIWILIESEEFEALREGAAVPEFELIGIAQQ